MDLYKKTQAGEDTAKLRIKYTQLQIEVIIKCCKEHGPSKLNLGGNVLFTHLPHEGT